MNWKTFFSDKRVQFGVGVCLLFLVASFIFKDNVRFALSDWFYPPTEEEKAKAGPTTMVSPAVLTILDILFSLVAGVGGWFIAAVGFLLNRVNSQPNATSQQVATIQPDGAVVASVDDLRRSFAIALARAAEDGDPVALEAARVGLRRPRAIELLSEAHSVGDLEAADALQAELRALSGVSPAAPTSSKKRGGSNA